MALTLAEIKKLPPKERLAKLKEYEAEQKRLREEEEKRTLEEEELALTEIVKEEKEVEEEETLLEKERKLREKPKEESLEQIAEEAPKKELERQQAEYLQHQAYQTEPRPISELYSVVSRVHETYHQAGRLTQTQLNNLEQARNEFYQKQDEGYNPAEAVAQSLMSKTDQLLGELRNPMARAKRYE